MHTVLIGTRTYSLEWGSSLFSATVLPVGLGSRGVPVGIAPCGAINGGSWTTAGSARPPAGKLCPGGRRLGPPPTTGYVHVRRIPKGSDASLDNAIRSPGPITGLVVDVHGNGGGRFDPATAFVNFDPHATGSPDRPRDAGPIALPADERTISAGQGWASWLAANCRARPFGSTTAGASSPRVERDVAGGLYEVVGSLSRYAGRGLG